MGTLAIYTCGGDFAGFFTSLSVVRFGAFDTIGGESAFRLGVKETLTVMTLGGRGGHVAFDCNGEGAKALKVENVFVG